MASILQADTIRNAAGTGAPTFTYGATMSVYPVLSTQSLVRAENTSGTSLANNTAVKIDFVTETFDTTGEWNNSTNVFTATNAGYYRVTCQLRLANVSTWTVGTAFNLNLYKNGVSYCTLGNTSCWASGGSSNSVFVAGTTLIQLAATNTLEIYANHDSGSTKSLATGAGVNWLCIERIG
jgi:hypothetical protein